MEPSALVNARLQAGKTTEQIAQATKLQRWIIEAIEQGQLERLPSGLYRRSYLRTYAAAVGLDPDRVVASFEPGQPGGEAVREAEPAAPALSEGMRGRLAVVTDVLVVSAITFAQLFGAALIVDMEVLPLARLASPALPALAASTLALYAGLLGATGVGTAGPRLFKVEFLPPPDAPFDCAQLVRRTGLYLTGGLRALVSGPDPAPSSPVQA